jgi:hypothetical protein
MNRGRVIPASTFDTGTGDASKLFRVEQAELSGTTIVTSVATSRFTRNSLTPYGLLLISTVKTQAQLR